jgi:hypothetical protein
MAWAVCLSVQSRASQSAVDRLQVVRRDIGTFVFVALVVTTVAPLDHGVTVAAGDQRVCALFRDNFNFRHMLPGSGPGDTIQLGRDDEIILVQSLDLFRSQRNGRVAPAK